MSKKILADRRFGPRTPAKRAGAKPIQWHNVAQDESPSGPQIRAARIHFGLTQTQAGALIGYTLNGWQRLEQGERTMKPKLWQFWLHEARKESA